MPPRRCLECGEAAYTRRGQFADFCGDGCRKAFNNRRALRGAELYDLFMATRYQRGLVKVLGLWRMLNRMAAAFRAEDVERRAGRQSWRDPRSIIERHPQLTATILRHRIGRGGVS